MLNNNESNWKCYTFTTNYKTTTDAFTITLILYVDTRRYTLGVNLMNILQAYH